MKKTIKVKKFIEGLQLTPIYLGGQKTLNIHSSDLNRPGLQLSGFFEYFSMDRVQLFGKGEIEYLKSLDPAVRQ